MNFPRIKQFKFRHKTSRIVTPEYVGRLDLLALHEYGDIRYYKPIAAANGIKCPIGMRIGIRTLPESIAVDLDNNVDSIAVTDAVDNHTVSLADWNHYGDFSSGYYTEVYEGRLLLLPTDESAVEWLNQYERM